MEFPPVSSRGFMKSAQMAAALAVVVSLGACRGSPSIRSITSPTAQLPIIPVPGPGTAVTGEITITDVAPPFGTTLALRDCSRRLLAICSELQMTVDVVIDGDLPDARMTVGFYNGIRRCGWAYLPTGTLVAGRRDSRRLSAVYVMEEVDEGEGSPRTTIKPCEMPSTTTRFVVEVWSRTDSRTPVFSREFDGTYTFALSTQ